MEFKTYHQWRNEHETVLGRKTNPLDKLLNALGKIHSSNVSKEILRFSTTLLL